MLENKLQNFWNVTLKQLVLKNYSSYNLLFIQNVNEIIYYLVLHKFQTAHRNKWLYSRVISDNVYYFEEIPIKTLMEVWSCGICTKRDQYGRGFNKFVQGFNEFGEL